MQLFVELKNCLKIVGIKVNQKNKFNRKNLLILFLFAYSFGVMIGFVLVENSTFTERSKVILGALTILLNAFTLYSNVSRHNKIFDLIEKIESIVDSSKWS